MSFLEAFLLGGLTALILVGIVIAVVVLVCLWGTSESKK